MWILFHPFGEGIYGFVCVKPCIDKKFWDESIIAEISVKINIVTIVTSNSPWIQIPAAVIFQKMKHPPSLLSNLGESVENITSTGQLSTQGERPHVLEYRC